MAGPPGPVAGMAGPVVGCRAAAAGGWGAGAAAAGGWGAGAAAAGGWGVAGPPLPLAPVAGPPRPLAPVAGAAAAEFVAANFAAFETAADLASKASIALARISKAKMADAQTSDAHAETAQISSARAETARTCPSAGALGGLGLGETKAASEAVLQHGESRVEAVEIARVALSLRYELVEAVTERVSVSPVAKRAVGRARNPRELASRQIDGHGRRDVEQILDIACAVLKRGVERRWQRRRGPNDGRGDTRVSRLNAGRAGTSRADAPVEPVPSRASKLVAVGNGEARLGRRGGHKGLLGR